VLIRTFPAPSSQQKPDSTVLKIRRRFVKQSADRAQRGTSARMCRKRLVSAQFPPKGLPILLDAALVLLLNCAQTIQGVGQFLTFPVVRCHANSFLDAIKNRITCVITRNLSVGRLLLWVCSKNRTVSIAPLTG